MNRYPKYKPSGVEWIGEIPKNWKIKRLKYFLKQNDGGVWGNDCNVLDENGTIVYRSTEINLDGTWNFYGEPAIRLLTKNEKDKASLIEGDLIVTKSSGSQLHIGKTALVTKEIEVQSCCYSNFMQRLRPLNPKTAKFLHIFLNSNLSREQYNYLSNTTTGLANLSAGLINEVILPSPPLEEQTAIANYLDDKTAKIDMLIEKKKNLIELLKEERTAVINKAVTRGIDPNVRLKSSGIDWLGEIPEHWEVKKLKYVLSIKSGDGIKSEEIYFEGTYPIYGGNGLMGYTEKYNSDKLDIIIGRVGAKCGNVRLVNGKKWISDNALVVELLKGYDYKFISIVLESINLNTLANQNAQPLITGTLVRDKVVSLTLELTEQIQIVQHIEAETKRIDGTISKIEKEIELLSEYRTALISEVVTGKIKV